MAYVGSAPAPKRAEIDSNSIETADLKDGAVTASKIAAGAIPPSNDASALTTGTLPIARIADGAVTAAKLAAGAATSNIGYTPANSASLSTVATSGSYADLSNKPTFVSSFNGSTGAVSYTAPVTSVNGSTGAVTIQTGASTTYGAVGTYFIGGETTNFSANSVTAAGETVAGSVLREPRNANSGNFLTNIALRDENGNRYPVSYQNESVSAGLSGTWRRMGMVQSRIGGTASGLEGNARSLFVRVS